MTNSMNRILACIPALCLLLAGCTQQAEPVQYDRPVVNFPMENEIVDAVVGEPVTFKAELVGGEKVTTTWSIDDRIESSAQEFTYVFSAPGSYIVKFTARNGSGIIEREYTAIVADAFNVVLSVGDSLEVTRTQLSRINVAAIVKSGAEIEHQWFLDGELKGEEAFFGEYLAEARPYKVKYHGENAVGSFEREFTVNVKERPLQMSYSIYDDALSIKKNQTITITATALYGGTGLQSTWLVDGEKVGSENSITWSSPVGGLFTLRYEGVNAKGETASREWKITVVSLGFMLDDFESGSALASWWTLAQNTPGIELVDNPDPSGINTSKKCMKDSVTGTGSTSGYFDLKGSVIKAQGIDMTQYNAIRIKVYLGKNKYYPRIQVGGTKYAPVKAPKFNGGWEELEFQFPSNFTAEQTITFRPLLKEDGSNIASGAVTDTNTRCVYIDDIEFLN